MKVTVCQIRNDASGLETDWAGLRHHVHENESDLVLLPEMAFHSWLASSKVLDLFAWETAVRAHDQWQERFAEMGAAILLGSRPVIREGGQRLNEAFVWDRDNGYRSAHIKYYLPNEEGFWEASWYDRGDGRFLPIQIQGAKIGFMICTDLWFTHHARAYGEAGIHILANPRATPQGTGDKWLAGGRAVAVISGAYCLSSNLAAETCEPLDMGGLGWIIDPDGLVLGTTSPEEPFITREISLAAANAAKQTYPRYVKR